MLPRRPAPGKDVYCTKAATIPPERREPNLVSGTERLRSPCTSAKASKGQQQAEQLPFFTTGQTFQAGGTNS